MKKRVSAFIMSGGVDRMKSEDCREKSTDFRSEEAISGLIERSSSSHREKLLPR